ncbi:hypothetical protein ABPG72_000347 [Tetrahymena utriculariae]
MAEEKIEQSQNFILNQNEENSMLKLNLNLMYKNLDDNLLKKELSLLPKQKEPFEEINMDFRVNCIGNYGYSLIGQELSFFNPKKLSLILANNQPGDFSSLFQEKLTSSFQIECLILDVERNLMLNNYTELLLDKISKIANLKTLFLKLKHNSIRDEGIKPIQKLINLNNLKHLKLDISQIYCNEQLQRDFKSLKIVLIHLKNKQVNIQVIFSLQCPYRLQKSIFLLSTQNESVQVAQCPQITSQHIPMYYQNYIIQNYLKIPKTNIIITNTGKISSEKDFSITGSFIYYMDISKSEDNIINAIKPDYTIIKMEYLEEINKILAITYFQVIIADVYTLKQEKNLILDAISSLFLIKNTHLALISQRTCQDNLIETMTLTQFVSFDACQYSNNLDNQIKLSKGFQLQNGLIFIAVLDQQGFQTWSLNLSNKQIQFHGYLDQPSNNDFQYTDIDIHDKYDIIFTVGSNYLINVFQIMDGMIYKKLNTTNLNGGQQYNLLNVKFIRSSSSQQESIYISDEYTIYILQIQTNFQQNSNLAEVIFTDQDYPQSQQTFGYQVMQWYYLAENNKFLIPLQNVYNYNQTYTFIFDIETLDYEQRQICYTFPFSKIYSLQIDQQNYFVSTQAQYIYVTQDNFSGNQEQVIDNNVYTMNQVNSFIQYKNCENCFLNLIDGDFITFNKVMKDEMNSAAIILEFYNLQHNQISQQAEAYYNGNNYWVIFGIPHKKNKEPLFLIIDIDQSIHNTLVSDNPDDNINETNYAIYSDINKQIIGLDVLGNIYIWDSQDITIFQGKQTITQYQCGYSEIGQLYHDGNVIYLIAACSDFQVISYNLNNGNTQLLDKLTSMPNHINSFESVSLLGYGDKLTSQIYLYKFDLQTSKFKLYLKFIANQSRDQSINLNYDSNTNLLWIQYRYSNVFIPFEQCLKDMNNCLSCQMDFYFNTDEDQQLDYLYGNGAQDYPFKSSQQLMTSFLLAQQYSQIIDGVKKIDVNLHINPQNSMTFYHELLNITFGGLINLNIINPDKSVQAQLITFNQLLFPSFQSLQLRNILIVYNITDKSPLCGLQFNNIKQVSIDNVNLNSNDTAVALSCFSIEINNSIVTLSNINIINQNFTDFNSIIQVSNSNNITLNNINLTSSVLKPQSQKLFIEVNYTYFSQGFSIIDGGAIFLDPQNSIFTLSFNSCNFTDIYSNSSDSNALSLGQSQQVQQIQLNQISLSSIQIINTFGGTNSAFLNAIQCHLTVQRLVVTQNQQLQLTNSFSENMFEQQTTFQVQNSEVVINNLNFSNFKSIPNSLSPLLMSASSSNVFIQNSIVEKSNFTLSLIDFNKGQLTIQNTTFQNIYQIMPKTRIIQESTQNNQGSYNSLIRITNSNLKIFQNSVFNTISCLYNCQGSSIYSSYSTLIVQDCRFVDSESSNGGSISVVGLNSNNNIIENTYFINNEVKNNGGAFYLQTNQQDVFKLNFINCKFTQNKAQLGYGGAMYINSYAQNTQLQNILLSNTQIYQNSALVAGGIYNLGINPILGKDSKIYNNIADYYGADKFSYPQELYLLNQSFFNQKNNAQVNELQKDNQFNSKQDQKNPFLRDLSPAQQLNSIPNSHRRMLSMETDSSNINAQIINCQTDRLYSSCRPKSLLSIEQKYLANNQKPSNIKLKISYLQAHSGDIQEESQAKEISICNQIDDDNNNKLNMTENPQYKDTSKKNDQEDIQNGLELIRISQIKDGSLSENIKSI